MTIKEALLAFVCGVAVVATAHTLMVDLEVRAQGDEAVDVCIDGGGVMRLATGTCPGGQQRVRLKEPEIERQCQVDQRAQVASLQNRIADLERDTAIDSNSTAVAPFEVVNDRDIVVFSVNEPAAGDLPALTSMFDDTGARVARIAARATGGEVSVSSARSSDDDSKGAASGVEATLAAYGVDYTDFTVNAGSNLRLSLGRRRESGNYALSTFNASGTLVAGFGESFARAGIVRISDASGKLRILINPESSGTGAGTVQILNDANLPVATFSGTGEAQSGLLKLTNNAGEPMVNAEVMMPKGVGAVRAGPGAFQHGVMFIPLPASYIEGKK